jgi:ABC-2 type transport system ATP-binding protein
MNAVETRKLSKRYGDYQALRAIDLQVPAGSLFGFLGPNGAGKTTAIRILMGLLRATSGEARMLDRDVWRDGARLRADVGYLPGELHLYDQMSGRALLKFVSAARRVSCDDEILRLTGCFELDASRRIRTYSRGMKQKLGLIAALMHKPRLLILDEPTTALDPLVRHTLFAELRRVAGEGRTVLFSSHTLAEVEELCSHVAILRAGELIEQNRVEVLRERALRHVRVIFDDGVAVPRPPDGLRAEDRSTGVLEATWVGPVKPLLSWLAEAPVRDVTISPPSLEDLFLGYYSGGGRPDHPAETESRTTHGERVGDKPGPTGDESGFRR